MTDLLAWNELPVRVRRSRRLLYEYIRTGELPVMESENTDSTPELQPEPEDDNVGNDGDDGGVTLEPDFEPVTYSFTSYADANMEEEYATGTAATTGVESNGYSQIEVLTNSVDGFVGEKYYVISNAKTDGSTAYELYSDAGTTGTGIYVTIEKLEN